LRRKKGNRRGKNQRKMKGKRWRERKTALSWRSGIEGHACGAAYLEKKRHGNGREGGSREV